MLGRIGPLLRQHQRDLLLAGTGERVEKRAGPREWLRYFATALIIAAAASLRAGLSSVLGTHAPFVTFYPAVILAALYGGLPAGLLATVLSAGTVVWWAEPVGRLFDIRDHGDWLGMALFLVGCTGISCICEAMHRAQARAIRAEELARIADARKRAAEQMRELTQRLTYHVDNSPLAVIEWGPDMRLTRWSGEAEHIFGWKAEEVLGKRMEDFRWIYTEDATKVAEVTAESQSGTNPRRFSSNRNYRKDGSVVHCEWYNSSLLDESGMVRSILSLVLDVTARKRAEADLKELNELLERRVAERTAEAEQRASQLRALASELALTEQRERQRLAQVLHDGLQQILVGAKWKLALMARSQDKGAPDLVSVVGRLVDDALETSRSLTADLSPPILWESGLGPALGWLASWMRDRHGLEVSLTARDRIESIPQDLTFLLFQATRELLFNVVKHAGVKEVRVELSAHSGRIQVTVSDEGMGFDPNQLRAAGGSIGGFGLFSIRERLNHLGGLMEIDSTPGGGCRINLVAPIAAAEATAAHGGPVRRHRKVLIDSTSQPEAAEVTAGKRVRIVLVDDHIVMRQGLARILQEEPDMEVVGEASDAGAALILVHDALPDVVLMDIDMPGMSGIEATRIIHAEMPDVRVIGLSIFEEGEAAATMEEAGAVRYLSKSGRSDALIAAIRTCASLPKMLRVEGTAK